ncbi:MAG: class B sortase [Lachnospiraceae bacterium]
MNKRKILVLFCVLAIGAILAYVSYYVQAQKNRSEIYEQLSQEVTSELTVEIEEEVEDVSEVEVVESPDEVIEEVEEIEEVIGDIDIDFDELKALNEDIYAWIDIPGTEVSYPILQHPTDDWYYLDYTVEHVNGLPGSIYTEGTYVGKDFSEFNTVIYGHNMNNGTMFGTLKLYKDEEYRQEHSEIYIYTETDIYVYDIYATVVYDDRHIPWTYKEEASYLSFVTSLSNSNDLSNYINSEMTLTSESQLITLSTCVANMTNNRYLVVAVRRD